MYVVYGNYECRYWQMTAVTVVKAFNLVSIISITFITVCPIHHGPDKVEDDSIPE